MAAGDAEPLSPACAPCKEPTGTCFPGPCKIHQARSAKALVGLPTMVDLEWLCSHPEHSMIMTKIDEVFVPMIVDENGQGPVIPADNHLTPPTPPEEPDQ
jgi:hypothetical protein